MSDDIAPSDRRLLKSTHGTVGQYRKGCRCERCRDAKKQDRAAYQARREAREKSGLPAQIGRPAVPMSQRPHGSYVTYCKGCRCQPCTTANTEYGKQRREIRNSGFVRSDF